VLAPPPPPTTLFMPLLWLKSLTHLTPSTISNCTSSPRKQTNDLPTDLDYEFAIDAAQQADFQSFLFTLTLCIQGGSCFSGLCTMLTIAGLLPPNSALLVKLCTGNSSRHTNKLQHHKLPGMGHHHRHHQQ
jgi:hypothetical protein